MRIATSALFLGAASAASFRQSSQQVLTDNDAAQKPMTGSFVDAIADKASASIKSLEDAFGPMTADAQALWDEIKLLVPEGAFDQASYFSKPKPHKRRHNWDHVVKGADVQKLWVQDADGEHRKVDGRIEDYNLRVNKVDPSKLGVDSVKQFSGYLDDEANDKHLFYCKLPTPISASNSFNQADQKTQGSLSRATTPRTTPWSSGSMVVLAAPP